MEASRAGSINCIELAHLLTRYVRMAQGHGGREPFLSKFMPAQRASRAAFRRRTALSRQSTPFDEQNFAISR
jgi:hypothetical protein